MLFMVEYNGNMLYKYIMKDMSCTWGLDGKYFWVTEVYFDHAICFLNIDWPDGLFPLFCMLLRESVAMVGQAKMMVCDASNPPESCTFNNSAFDVFLLVQL